MIDENILQQLYRYRWCIFTVLAVSYFFVYFHRMTVSILGQDMIEDVGGTVGVLSSVYFWTYTAMQIPSGLLADRLGPRRSASIFMTLAALGSFLTAFSDNFLGLVIGKIMIAMGMAVIYIPLMKVISVWFPHADFPQLNGIVIAVGNIGAIAASAPLEYLELTLGGWRQVFILLGIVTFILALLCMIVIRDHPHQKGLPSVEEVSDVQSTNVDPTNGKMPLIKGLKMVASGGRKFWCMAIAYLLIYGTIMVFQGTWAKFYFKDVYGFLEGAAWFITAIGVGKICSTLIIGRMSSSGRISSKKRIISLGVAVYMFTWAVIFIWAGDIDCYWFWLVICLVFGVSAGFMTLSFSQVKDWYPVAVAGTTVSVMNTMLFLGSSLLTTLSAFIIGSESALDDYRMLWGVMFIASICGLILVLLSKERKNGDLLVSLD